MDLARRSARIRDLAREVGFDAVALGRLGPPRHGRRFVEWLERGDHAGMRYLERQRARRLRPDRLVEGGRSVVCVALQYHPLGDERVEGDLWPRVARYARGDDYHEVMLERLERLAERVLAAYPGTKVRPYVDTGPVLERDLAATAGLGAIGKNTNLLLGERGSWFLLGELLLSLALEPDPPIADLCGSCTRCLEACPTGALPEPYRLDSNRCISYWTIEHRGEIPPAIRSLLGEWVFGCDLCQEACPWNDAPPAAHHPELELPERRRELDLEGLLRLDRESYVARFRRSPMKRARLEGLRRNAAVAMGNRGDPRYIPALTAALEDDQAMVREHSAWALGRIGGERAHRALERAAAREPDATVRTRIVAALRGGTA